MLQRIQSIYIGLAVILTILMFFLPFAAFIAQGDTYYYFGDVLRKVDETKIVQYNFISLIILSITLLTVVLSFITYKQRVLQMKITYVAFFLNIILEVGLFFLVDYAVGQLGGNVGKDAVSYQYVFIFPLINLVLLFLAIRAIRKDEALVRSADRFR